MQSVRERLAHLYSFGEAGLKWLIGLDLAQRRREINISFHFIFNTGLSTADNSL